MRGSKRALLVGALLCGAFGALAGCEYAERADVEAGEREERMEELGEEPEELGEEVEEELDEEPALQQRL